MPFDMRIGDIPGEELTCCPDTLQAEDEVGAVVQSIKEQPTVFRFLPERFRGHPALAALALQSHGDNLRWVPEDLKGNPRFVRLATLRQPKAVLHASEELQKDRAFMISLVERDHRVLRFLNSDFRGDLEVATLAVTKHGSTIQHLSQQCRDVEHVHRTAIQTFPDALQFLAAHLRDAADLVKDVVVRDGMALRWASARLADDDEVADLAVRQCPAALQFVSDRLKLVHLARNGDLLQAAGLGGNPDCVRAAAAGDPRALRFAQPQAAPSSLVREAILSDPKILGCLPLKLVQPLLEDEEVVRCLARVNGMVLRWASPSLQHDRELVLNAVGCNGMALRFAGPWLRDDAEVVALAVRRVPRSHTEEVLSEASARLQGEVRQEAAATGVRSWMAVQHLVGIVVWDPDAGWDEERWSCFRDQLEWGAAKRPQATAPKARRARPSRRR